MFGTTTEYSVSLTDSASPPSQNFTDTRVTLSSTLTNQKLVIFVSYTGITDTDSVIQCPSPTDQLQDDKTTSEASYLNDEQWNLLFAAVACAIILLSTIVVVLALKQSSQKPKDGFASKLPPHQQQQPQSPAFSTSTPARSQGSTPLWSNSGSQSAFKRTGKYAQQSPPRTSPKHNLFSQ